MYEFILIQKYWIYNIITIKCNQYSQPDAWGFHFRFGGYSSADMSMNCAFCEESPVFPRNTDFDITMNIRYGGISEINADDLKFGFSYIFL
jgi:hypothetical protein